MKGLSSDGCDEPVLKRHLHFASVGVLILLAFSLNSANAESNKAMGGGTGSDGAMAKPPGCPGAKSTTIKPDARIASKSETKSGLKPEISTTNSTATRPAAKESKSSTSVRSPAKTDSKLQSIKAEKEIAGWTIYQNSSYRGSIILQICAAGARLQSQDLVCLMEPGRKIGYLTHQQNKRYLEMDPSKGMKGLGHLSWFPGPEKVTKIGDEQLRNLKTTHYLIEKYRGKDPYPYWITDLWVCNDLGISKEFAGDCARICMLPAEYGLPVKVVRLYSSHLRREPLSKERTAELRKQYGYCMTHPKFAGNDARLLLDLQRDAKPTALKPSLFKLEKSFKKVKTEVDLIMTDERDALLKELDEE